MPAALPSDPAGLDRGIFRAALSWRGQEELGASLPSPAFPAGMFALSRHRKAPGKGAWPLEVESLGQRPHDRLD
jgi:hypothetical protein